MTPEITAALEEVKRLDAEARLRAELRSLIGDTYTCFDTNDPGAVECPSDNICAGCAKRHAMLKLTEEAPLLASELERVRKENAWQDIASAPRDGTYILAWRALLDVPLVVTWERPAQTPPMMRLVSTERHDHEGFWRQPMSAKPTPYQPTHWQPLPLPPQAKGE